MHSSRTEPNSKPNQLFGREVPSLVWRSVSAWGLVVSSDMSLSVWEPLLLDALRARYASNTRTRDKAVAEARRLLRYLQARGAVRWGDVTPELVSDWCWASRPGRSGAHQRTAPATARNRQWAARATFEEAATVGAPVDPTVLIGEPIRRTADASAATRPLTDTEAALVRDAAESVLAGSRIAVIAAMAFCGGSASEIACLRVGDVDIEATTITFGGESARVTRLDAWSILVMRRFVASQRRSGIDAGDLLCVTDKVEAGAAAHSVTVRLGELLRTAGLNHHPGVSARSIRLHTARTMLDRDGIEAAARFLGAVSLDTTASSLAYDWQDDDG